MLSLGINPYLWNQEEDIMATVGGLSLTRDNGSVIPVKNLDEEIEV